MGTLWRESRDAYWRIAGSQIPLGRGDVHRGVPGKTDTAFVPQLGGPRTRPWKGRRRHCNTSGPSTPGLSYTSIRTSRNWRIGLGRGGSAGTARTPRRTASTTQQHTQCGGEQKRRVHRDAVEGDVTADQRDGQQRRDGQCRRHQFSRRTT